MNLNLTTTEFQKISTVEIPDIFYNRFKTNNDNLDTIFGEGILPGSSITLTATPGAGKSTLSFQLCEMLSKNGYRVGYASGEESRVQLAFTCKRLNIEDVLVANITDVDSIVHQMQNFDIMVVDSFQALTSKHDHNTREFEKYAVDKLVTRAKELNCALIFIVHLTKLGQMKGTTLLPHTVDVNIRIDKVDDDPEARVISVYKNRWGPTGEYNCRLSATGFEFLEKIIEINKPASKKEDKKKKAQDRILEALSGGCLGEDELQDSCDDLGYPRYIIYQALKELRDNLTVIKHGRGQTTVYELKN